MQSESNPKSLEPWTLKTRLSQTGKTVRLKPLQGWALKLSLSQTGRTVGLTGNTNPKSIEQ
jgi:hypothetical protein